MTIQHSKSMSKGRGVQEMGETNFYVNMQYLKVGCFTKLAIHIFKLRLKNKLNGEYTF